MVSEEEYGSLLAEYESFRDSMMDELSKLRRDIEHLKEHMKDLKSELEEMKK
ncbi:MAG TPA: hypothetical protein VJB66_03770 [Candidatus Nanoarchaeia archaeon]|nr:hypothetical protein [Candidatus Nanoarchaeia archaeon]